MPRHPRGGVHPGGVQRVLHGRPRRAPQGAVLLAQPGGLPPGRVGEGDVHFAERHGGGPDHLADARARDQGDAGRQRGAQLQLGEDGRARGGARSAGLFLPNSAHRLCHRLRLRRQPFHAERGEFGSPPCFFDGQAFKSIVMNFRKDENTIAENCLMAFERNRLAMFNRAISTAGTSAVSNQSQQNSGGTDQEDRGSMDIERVTSIEDRTRVLRRKHFATLMVRLLTAVQKGSK
eukprot:1184475-Prorocentrum_minimum.AAC.1